MSIKTRLSNYHIKETNQQIKLLNNNMPGYEARFTNESKEQKKNQISEP
jgi:predicted phage tail protein